MTISYNVPEKRLSKAIKQAHKDFFESYDDEDLDLIPSLDFMDEEDWLDDEDVGNRD